MDQYPEFLTTETKNMGSTVSIAENQVNKALKKE